MTTMRLVGVALLVLALGGCDLAAEELAERAAEQVTGGDVEIDTDGGLSIESDDGSMTVEEDGDMTMETDEGTFEAGSGRLPADFPSVVPLPDGGQLITGTRLDTDDGVAWSANWQFDAGDPFDVLDGQARLLEDAGFTREEEFSTNTGGEGMAGVMFVGSGYRLQVSALGAPDDFILGYQVFEEQPAG